MAILKLEVFRDPAHALAEDIAHETDAAEHDRLAAYEQGYSAGWEDAARTLGDEQTAIRADLARNLGSISLTFDTARAQMLQSLGPVVVGLGQALLPQFAQQSFGAVVSEQLAKITESLIGPTLELQIAPQDRPAIEALLATLDRPVTLRLEPTLGPGQALIRLAEQEVQIDMPRAVDALLGALKACLNPDNRSR